MNRRRKAKHVSAGAAWPVFLTAFLLTIAGVLPVPARADSSSPQFHVGYQVMDIPFPQGDREKILTVAVWYPTAQQPGSFTYGGSTRGNVTLNAKPLPSERPYPLLVFSHGFGGGGIGSVFFTEALAASGWIVAAPDHHDSQSAVRIRGGQTPFDRRVFLNDAKAITRSGPEDRSKYLYRLREIQAVIDYLTTSDPYRGLVDAGRLAVGGHSLGGFTALGVCGAIAGKHDPRIKAVLLFSTGAGGYLYTPEELHRVKIPLMLFMGEREKRQKRGGSTMVEIAESIYREAAGQKYFLEVKGANHFSFNNRFNDNPAYRWLSGNEEQFDVIRRYSIAFLEQHAAGRPGADPILDQKDPLLVRYLKKP